MFANDSDVAVWKDVFFQVNFNVDQCLSTHIQKSDLETLRRGLKQYGTELHVAMSDILKTETEAIVYLAENLTNLSSKIDGLFLPVAQLLEEIRILHEAIKSVQDGFIKSLTTINDNLNLSKHTKLQMDMLLSSIYISDILQMEISDQNENLVYLERSVQKYSFQKMYLKEVGVKNLEIDLNGIETRLLTKIEHFFLRGLKQQNPLVVTRCLRMYVDLCQQNKAEIFYREAVVRPAIKSIFTQKNLEKHKQQLCELYQEALNFLNYNMKVVLEVSKTTPDLKGFNFIINSFWLEVDKQLQDNLPTITAPGNPDVFQKRFKETWKFFTAVAQKCNNLDLLRSDKTFQEHIKRFNLPVYFEIRFQQIATKLEEEIVTCKTIYEGNSEGFKIKITAEILKAVKRCFDNDTFLVLLAGQFLKLSMLILSRYLTWLDAYIKNLGENSAEAEKFSISALIDLELLKSRLANEKLDINNSVFKVFPQPTHHLLLQAMRVNRTLLDKHLKHVQTLITKMKYKECMLHLSKVESIPRLYRRTNRNFPQEASNYVVSACDVLLKLNTTYKEINTTDVFLSTTNVVIEQTSSQFLTHVQEVLNNVCKTEESLRRLKNRNQTVSEDAGGHQGSGDTISDEKKIREQIKLDINYFVTTLLQTFHNAPQEYLNKLKNVSV